MYDELVKRLRETSCGAEDTLWWQAADTIEDLEFACNRYEKDYKALCEYLPKWIPVTERLPEKNGSYLVYIYGEVTEMNCWHGKWHRLGDDYTKAVTNWMPLPQPPKEET